MESDATLIICPVALRQQWLDEICKHVRGNLKILDYEGSPAAPVYPVDLVKYDLVITTYGVLNADLKLTYNHEVSYPFYVACMQF